MYHLPRQCVRQTWTSTLVRMKSPVKTDSGDRLFRREKFPAWFYGDLQVAGKPGKADQPVSYLIFVSSPHWISHSYTVLQDSTLFTIVSILSFLGTQSSHFWLINWFFKKLFINNVLKRLCHNRCSDRLLNILFTVTPVYNDHPRDPKIVEVVDRWSLFFVLLCYKHEKWDPENGDCCSQVVVSLGLTVMCILMLRCNKWNENEDLRYLVCGISTDNVSYFFSLANVVASRCRSEPNKLRFVSLSGT